MVSCIMINKMKLAMNGVTKSDTGVLTTIIKDEGVNQKKLNCLS